MQAVALVTGGGVRVGRAIVEGLVADGYSVVINYHSSSSAAEDLAERIRADGGEAIAVGADVADREAVEEMLGAAVEAFGRIDLVVNNAAVFDERAFFDVDDQLWDRTLAINLNGSFYVAQAAARRMVAAGGGRIVNICGTTGVSPIGNYTAYCVAKAGVDMLTRCMAEALAPDVQVNGVAPGTVLFPEGTPLEEQQRVIAGIPTGEIGTPEDVADAVRFLARAPSYMTGTIITVDGGAGLGST